MPASDPDWSLHMGHTEGNSSRTKRLRLSEQSETCRKKQRWTPKAGPSCESTPPSRESDAACGGESAAGTDQQPSTCVSVNTNVRKRSRTDRCDGYRSCHNLVLCTIILKSTFAVTFLFRQVHFYRHRVPIRLTNRMWCLRVCVGGEVDVHIVVVFVVLQVRLSAETLHRCCSQFCSLKAASTSSLETRHRRRTSASR